MSMGEESLMPATKPPGFDAEQLSWPGLVSIQSRKRQPIWRSASRVFVGGCPQDDGDAGQRERLISAEKQELAELRRRMRVLEMENEVLRRASAYIGGRVGS